MSCRNTPAGSLATTFAKRLFGLTDSQCTSIFHDLTREHTTLGAPTVSEEEYNNTIRSITITLYDRSDIWPENSSILERAEARLLGVRGTGLPEAKIAYATTKMLPKSQGASEAIKTLLTNTSENTDLSLSDVKREYVRLMNEYTQLAHSGHPNRANLQTPPDSTIANIPKNNATLYAIDKLSGWIKCPSCNKGRYLGVNDPTHGNCVIDRDVATNSAQNFIDRISLALRNGEDIEEVINYNSRLFNFDPESFTFNIRAMVDNGSRDNINAVPRFNIIPPQENIVTPAVEEVSERIVKKISSPWDMDSFQKAYDKAKAKINQENNYFLTPNLDLEAIPGGITGGLGSHNTGNSFGIEIEIDFPSDTYPYSARYELARRLYAEGITMFPEVASWHYVGPNRDGGNFTFGSKDWICEFDRTVDDVEGERGIEIKSQIMFDEPETWKNLRKVCEIISELGGKPTTRTGLHVNVGGAKFPSDNPANHNALLKLAATYDDTILRLAHNPLSANSHRGRRYCQPVQVPPNGFSSVNEARSYANHYQAFNLNHLPEEGSRRIPRASRVEVRVWDSTIDPVRIQTAITLSLALVQGGIEQIEPNAPEELAGTHRTKYNRARLSGQAWEESTEAFRSLVSFVSDLGPKTDWHKDSLTSLFASSRWQSGQNYYEDNSDEEDYDD